MAVTAAAVALDAWRRESLFYANLGISPAWPARIAAAVAGVLELGMWMITRVGAG